MLGWTPGALSDITRGQSLVKTHMCLSRAVRQHARDIQVFLCLCVTPWIHFKCCVEPQCIQDATRWQRIVTFGFLSRYDQDVTPRYISYQAASTTSRGYFPYPRKLVGQSLDTSLGAP